MGHFTQGLKATVPFLVTLTHVADDRLEVTQTNIASI